jgi:hypothetical protein
VGNIYCFTPVEMGTLILPSHRPEEPPVIPSTHQDGVVLGLTTSDHEAGVACPDAVLFRPESRRR